MQVYAWGRGEDGQLGLGDSSDQLKPRLIETLSDKGVTQVVCGSGHTVVLTQEGKVFTWGRGDDGRLGHGDRDWKHEPKLVEAIKSKRIVQITCGSYHTAAVSDTGELFTWGGGMYGKLGHGNEDGHNIPRKVEKLIDKFVLQVACGSRHTVVLVSNRPHVQQTSVISSEISRDTDVYSWGDQDNGVAGHGETTGHQFIPRLLAALKGKSVCQIAACGFHTGAITEFGEVYTWGEGKFGRLGHGVETNQAEPKLVEDKKIQPFRIVQIACGGFHTAAITENGQLFTWGGGEHGQLGHGNKENYPRPTQVKALENVKISQITCGWSHTVGLTVDGKVWSFGNGDHGKLGHGDADKVTVPVRVEGLCSKVISRVASYNEHTAALAEPPEGLKQMNFTLAEDFSALVNNEMFSDIVFIVEGKKIFAHRVILAARSLRFCAMLQSGMKESRESEVIIKDTRHEIFLALLQYLYSDIVDVEPEVAIELFVLADLYTLDKLKQKCEAIVHRNLCHTNSALLLNLSDQYQTAAVRSLCMKYIIRHFEVISRLPEFGILNRDVILEILQNR